MSKQGLDAAVAVSLSSSLLCFPPPRLCACSWAAATSSSAMGGGLIMRKGNRVEASPPSPVSGELSSGAGPDSISFGVLAELVGAPM
eukprot:961761-Pyramimonas_sp.AAC.1